MCTTRKSYMPRVFVPGLLLNIPLEMQVKNHQIDIERGMKLLNRPYSRRSTKWERFLNRAMARKEACEKEIARQQRNVLRSGRVTMEMPTGTPMGKKGKETVEV